MPDENFEEKMEGGQARKNCSIPENDPRVSEDKIAGNQKGGFKWSEADRPVPPQQSSAVHRRPEQEGRRCNSE